MKTNTLLLLAIVILVGIVLYLLLNSPGKSISTQIVPAVIYEESRPRDTVIVGGWGGWGGWALPSKPFGGAPPPPPPPPGGGGAPPPPPPPPPPAPPSESPPSGFLDGTNKEKEGFVSSAASYPFA